jgi:3-methyladenine DNA glycosylase AlkD
MNEWTAKIFMAKLSLERSTAELKNVQRFYSDKNSGNKFLGVRMSAIFELAKHFIEMPAGEIKKLLQSEYYEARMGAVSIMDFQARGKKTTIERKKELFDLYLKYHNKINNWDLVDRSAPYVVGGYLFDKPRGILYQLAESNNVWERRTAIVSTYFFIRQNDLSDTFQIAGLLISDKHELIQKAVGSWVREAGKRDKLALIEFLDNYARVMPLTMLRNATEKLNHKEKQYYMELNGRKKKTDN